MVCAKTTKCMEQRIDESRAFVVKRRNLNIVDFSKNEQEVEQVWICILRS